PKQPEEKAEEVELPPIIVGNPVRKKPEGEKKTEIVRIPPIVNGDVFTTSDLGRTGWYTESSEQDEAAAFDPAIRETERVEEVEEEKQPELINDSTATEKVQENKVKEPIVEAPLAKEPVKEDVVTEPIKEESTEELITDDFVAEECAVSEATDEEEAEEDTNVLEIDELDVETSDANESIVETIEETSENAEEETTIEETPIVEETEEASIEEPQIVEEAENETFFEVDDQEEVQDVQAFEETEEISDRVIEEAAEEQEEAENEQEDSLNDFVPEEVADEDAFDQGQEYGDTLELEEEVESETFEQEDQEEVSDTESDEEQVIEAKIPDSLKLIDEEVDMSETSDEVDNDNTGYYTTEGFDRRVGEISLKLNDAKVGINSGSTAHNQINMEDYDVEIKDEQPKKQKKHLRYTPPPIDMLINCSTEPEAVDYEANANSLEEVLHNLRVEAKVIKVTTGPAVTRYELEMPPGQSVKKITNCADDIAYALASSGKVRIEAPIRGKRAVGVEVPNASIAVVSLREVVESKDFNEAKSCLTLGLGKDITGNIMTCNLEKMPHLLIAGTTGSGKSACLNSIIISMLYKSSPDDVRLILIDPKQVEFVLYRDMPHLLMKNIINDSSQAINAFKWAREEMDRRYTLFAKYSVRNLADFNDSVAVKTGMEPKLPRIVIIVDELAELMLAKNAKELEQNIMSMAQKARAAGMHLILATQRPSVDVLTGTIKANLPSRIAFAVKSITDSRTILDQIGAETLLGRGDMLYAPLDSNEPKRVQGAFITTEEIENIVNFVRNNNETDYDEAAENIIMKKQEEAAPSSDEEKSGEISEDPLMKDVLRKVIETNQASASQIQRRFAVGYNRASRIIDQMEENGYIGPLDGAKPREVYITREKFIELYGEDI
ncbi:MAG: DNA translocase FtsK, partial [Clostridiales bacterium]|nr:DNA translocase FtsK [Clostridiales bacterium]